MRRRVYKELHEDIGHLGLERVLALARDRFYWPYMRRDIEYFITRVSHCVKNKRPTLPTREPLHPIVTTSPFQLIAVDYVHLERSSGGYEYILVTVDHFTRYAQAYATKNKSGAIAAEKIINDFVPRFGFPEKINHDMGRKQPIQAVREIVWASNLKDKDGTTTYSQCVSKWQTAMKEAYAKASNLASKNASRGKKQYDKKVRSTVLQPGDRVLVRNLTPRGGPGKLQSFWEDEVHERPGQTGI
ncbi:Retrovirus-related Pol poly from transposon [Paramuricea clavata]|uniref:Retrovirus-related Pol poly from transposon n=1 Tax=Paramuricea clavata TaxID=317549 RepID=A0A6S7GSA0_PARCT|nr:Retrovirus-related Pol poly from transposon [Paramuricea clavata]